MKRWVKFLALFDLTSQGSPSFSKLMCLLLAVGCIVRGTLSTGIVVALLAASFGRSAWLAFLYHKRKPDAGEDNPATA